MLIADLSCNHPSCRFEHPLLNVLKLFFKKPAPRTRGTDLDGQRLEPRLPDPADFEPATSEVEG
jgi:hypothetical protein